MSWTYSGDPTTTPKDEIRFLIGDTDDTNPLLQDAEINYQLKIVYGTGTPPAQGNYLPAALCVDVLIARFARVVDTSLGDLHVSAGNQLKNFQELSRQLRNRATITRVKATVTGTSRAERIAVYSDPDRQGTVAQIDDMTDIHTPRRT